jgi:hypothetical protein
MYKGLEEGESCQMQEVLRSERRRKIIDVGRPADADVEVARIWKN